MATVDEVAGDIFRINVALPRVIFMIAHTVIHGDHVNRPG